MPSISRVSPSKRTPLRSRCARAAAMSVTPNVRVAPPCGVTVSSWPMPRLAGNRRAQLAPSPVGQGVDRFEAEKLLEPAARTLHVGDADGRCQVAGVADRPGLPRGGCLIEVHGGPPLATCRPVFILESLSCQTLSLRSPACFTTAGRCRC